jgi:septum formation inhibitor MinC
MTDEQIKQKIAQSEQDSITLDYSKWSAQRLKAKLPNDHRLWQQQRDRVLARQQSDNAAAGRKYRASLEAEKAEKRREKDAEIDRELEPQKQRLMREWLANNPDQTAADFEKKAWHLLKENLIERAKAEAFEAESKRQSASGRYSL